MAQVDPLGLTCLTADRVAPLQVVAVHRGASKHSHAILITASDSATYILKRHTSEMPLRLFHEALGAKLGACLGLPMAPWAVLHVDSDALVRGAIYCADQKLLAIMSAGQHFGSRVSTDAGPFFEVLPSAIRHSHLEVDTMFAAIRLFDFWVGQCDRRQYVASLGPDRAVDLRFIRNSGILADEECRLLQPGGSADGFLHASRSGAAQEACDTLLKQIIKLPQSTLEQMVQSIPEPWRNAVDPVQVIKHLRLRQAMLESLWHNRKRIPSSLELRPSITCDNILDKMGDATPTRRRPLTGHALW